MENSMSKIIIETTVRQTLKSLKEDPKRSIRNLVDMALQFSKGRFQSRFFEAAHTMLENENSAYYDLIYNATNHIETEHLIKFGMNLGYNSFTWGAQHIRTNENVLGFNIPWVIFFQMDQPECLEHLNQYHEAIKEGEELGIYSWMLFTQANSLKILPLVQEHPDSAFFLFCDPKFITPIFLEKVSQIKHLMLILRYNDDADEACAMLRDAGLPYSVFYSYSSEDVESITNGELFRDAQQLHPIFTVLIPQPDCPDKTRQLVYQASVQARNKQYFQTLPWELYDDTRSLDKIISDDACCMFIDGQGNVHGANHTDNVCGNLFQCSLTNLMKKANPKKNVQHTLQ